MYCQQEKKNTQKSLLTPGTDRHSFSQWNSGKKGHQNNFSRLSSTPALLVDFASSRSNQTCASSGWKSQTEVKTKRQNHLRHANNQKKKKKKRNENRSPKSQAGVIWNFAVALSLAKPFNTGETFCGPAGTKITIVLHSLESLKTTAKSFLRLVLVAGGAIAKSCRLSRAAADSSPSRSGHRRTTIAFLAKSRTHSTHSPLWQPPFSLFLAALSDP